MKRIMNCIEIKMKKYSLLLIIIFLLFSGVASAAMIESQGSATIVNGAVNKARLTAIQDAIRQAILQTSSSVTTSSMMSDNVLVMDSTQVHASGHVKNVMVVDEWQDEEQINVLIRAEVLSDSGRTDARKAYRRKVAVVQFHVLNRRAIQDLNHIETEYPRNLIRQLEEKGGVIGVDATDYILNHDARDLVLARANPDKQTIKAMAESLGVQFIVTGIFKNLEVVDKVLGDTRQLNVEVQVYDGITGTMISRHQYNKKVLEGLIDKDFVFNSPDFNETRLGVALNEVMQQQVVAIKAGLDKLPVTVRVVRSEGKKVYFNAGVTSLIKVGDMLMAYKVDSSPVFRLANTMDFGSLEEPVATVTVTKVQPLFAMGELETDQVSLKPGDLLRFGW